MEDDGQADVGHEAEAVLSIAGSAVAVTGAHNKHSALLAQCARLEEMQTSSAHRLRRCAHYLGKCAARGRPVATLFYGVCLTSLPRALVMDGSHCETNGFARLARLQATPSTDLRQPRGRTSWLQHRTRAPKPEHVSVCFFMVVKTCESICSVQGFVFAVYV